MPSEQKPLYIYIYIIPIPKTFHPPLPLGITLHRSIYESSRFDRKFLDQSYFTVISRGRLFRVESKEAEEGLVFFVY